MEYKVPATITGEAVNVAAKCQGCKSDKEFTLLGKKYPAGTLKFKCFKGVAFCGSDGKRSFKGCYVYTDDVSTVLNDAFGVPTEAVCDLALAVGGPALKVPPIIARPQKKDK